MDRVFDALADPSRRKLLDSLYQEPGARLVDLCTLLAMSRQAVTKHLVLLEDAGLVVTVRKGREKFHYLNPVPLRQVHDRWLRKFDEPRADALIALKGSLEAQRIPQEVTMGFAYQIVVATTPEQAWKALLDPQFTRQYWFGRTVASDWKVGSRIEVLTPEGTVEVHGTVLEFDPPRRLVYTWNSQVLTGESRVVFEVQALGPLVKLSLLHDIDATIQGFEQAANGWTFILNGIKTLLETGKPLPSIPWKKG